MKTKDFKAGFYVVTGKGNWGRGIELPTAFKSAYQKLEDKKVNYVVTVFLFKDYTSDEIIHKVLFDCYGVNDWGNIVTVMNIDPEDEKLRDEYLIGFAYYNNKTFMKAKPKTSKIVKQ